MHLKKVIELDGNTAYKIGRCITIWRDLSINNIYSTHPYPIMFKIILAINTASIIYFINIPEINNDYV